MEPPLFYCCLRILDVIKLTPLSDSVPFANLFLPAYNSKEDVPMVQVGECKNKFIYIIVYRFYYILDL